MAIKPILFNTEMVQAVLDGRKTVTRRCVKFLNGKNVNWTGYVKDGLMLFNGTNEPCIKPCQYQPGDILYVRESIFQGVGHYLDVSGETVSFLTDDFEYYADGLHEKGHWNDKHKMCRRPSIHMPKEAARIWLKVTNVSLERLHDITENGALKEGAQGVRCNHAGLGAYGCTDCMNTGWLEPPILDFMQIWDSTIKKSDLDMYGWNANPWVWVIEFERCEKPKI